MFRPSTFKLLKIVSRSKVGFRVLKTEQANILPQKFSDKKIRMLHTDLTQSDAQAV